MVERYILDYVYNKFFYRAIKKNTTLKKSVANRLLGEAYFLRAFHYFYLVNLYGGVPLVLSTDYNKNVNLPRSSEAELYVQILNDLTQSEGLLDSSYVGGDVTIATSERVRPNLSAVNALKARVYLFQKKFVEAEAYSTKVISDTQYSLDKLDVTFLKNSRETIWAIQPVVSGYNTYEASQFILTATGPTRSRPIYASNSLVNSFEAGDNRKNIWMGNVKVGSKTYYYSAKYKVKFGVTELTEYPIILRLAEQYLIRAEARNEQNNRTGAIQDLNILRTRARAIASVDVPNPLPNLLPTLDRTQIATAIMQERRIELFTEWGHRWFDLKRTGSINAVLTAAAAEKGNDAKWEGYKTLYPIPESEILLNPAITQNPGYIN